MLYPLDLRVDPLVLSPLPVSLDLSKLHGRVDAVDDDDLLNVYVPAAVDWAEGYMHRTIFSRAHRWVLRDFPRDARQEIRLPRGKTQSIESIVYKRGGAVVTLTGPSSGSPAGTDWLEDLRGDDGAVLMPKQGESWPSVDDDVPDPVVVNFTAGWAANSVPQGIIHALLFSIDDAIEIRGATDIGDSGSKLDRREMMLSGWTMARLYR